EGGTAVAHRGHQCDQRVAAAAHMREVGLHLLARRRLKATPVLGFDFLQRRQPRLQLADSAVVASLADLAQKNRRRYPARAGLLDALVPVAPVVVELARARLARSVATRRFITQVSAYRVARAVQLPRNRSDRLTPSGHHSYLHCLLLGQHRRQRHSRHPYPGGSLLLRRSGSVLLRRQQMDLPLGRSTTSPT